MRQFATFDDEEMSYYLQTGQITCHDASGRTINCEGSGQDAALHKGTPWPAPRFEVLDDVVRDQLTGLVWLRDGNMAQFPLRWQEAIEYVSDMNASKAFGFSDWRLPNRRELRSLMSFQTKKPALPESHPFINVFSGWYWSSTTAAINTSYAWYVHMEGARMFYGHKEQFFLLWPVQGRGAGILPATGQTLCYNSDGQLIPCMSSGQDGEFRSGVRWPEPRFEGNGNIVIDRLTDLCWRTDADLTGGPETWEGALEAVAELNRREHGTSAWRLPNINELESLVDCSTHSPALPREHPFVRVREGYWSSTTSMFEPDWAWALYLAKGATGVGQKRGAHFHVWTVSDLPMATV